MHCIRTILFHCCGSYRQRSDHRAAAGWLSPPSSTTPREARPPSIQLHASSVWRTGREGAGGLALGSSPASPVRLPRPPPAVGYATPQATKRPVEQEATALRFFCLFVSLCGAAAATEDPHKRWRGCLRCFA